MPKKTPKITNFKLTGRERDILSILWNANKSMIASEIVKAGDDTLTTNTVQATLKKLLKRELIQVDQIVYSGTVLSRSYIPTFTEEEFTLYMISTQIIELKKFNISPCKFFEYFFSNHVKSLSKEEVNSLTTAIQENTKGVIYPT